MAESISTNDGAARRDLRELLARYHCRVHQPDDPPLFQRDPRAGMRSHHWRWRDLEPLLRKLGEVVDLGSGGPRRTLRLVSPGLNSGTTPTFWGSIQVILPGEVATAHRHSANAFRFVMHGHGAWTTVNGERYPMGEGDLVLTPAWTWHDHHHEGQAPMIWLDVLDISLMQALQASFFDAYAEATQKVGAVPDLSYRQYGSGLMRPVTRQGDPAVSDNPLLAYPAAMSQAALAQAQAVPSDPFDDVVLEYRNPRDGGPAMRTMSMTLQDIRPGMRGRARRSTGSRLYYVVQGEGTSIVEDEEFHWETGDFMTIAPWNWHAHRNRSTSMPARLFQVNDHPVLQALGFYREEERA